VTFGVSLPIGVEWLWLGGRAGVRGRTWDHLYLEDASLLGVDLLVVLRARLLLGARIEIGVAVGGGLGWTGIWVNGTMIDQFLPRFDVAAELAIGIGDHFSIGPRFGWVYFQWSGLNEYGHGVAAGGPYVARALEGREVARSWILWALIAVVVSLGACRTRRRPRSIGEDFETVCDGTPCGWERVRGSPIKRSVETIHPGEHGLRLTGESRARPSIGSFRDPRRVVLARDDGDGALRSRQRDSRSTSSSPTTRRTTRRDRVSIHRSRLIDGGTTFLNFEDGGDASVTHVTAIAIRKLGSGSCDVTNLAIEEGGIQTGC
jgi:hypothetical protein